VLARIVMVQLFHVSIQAGIPTIAKTTMPKTTRISFLFILSHHYSIFVKKKLKN